MREMLAVGRGKDLSPLRMPAELMSRLNDLFSGQSEDRSPAKPLSWLSEWLNKYTSVPVLALGTAAALLIAAVLIVPVWRSLKEPSQLDFGPSQEIPRPVSQSRDGMPKAAAPPAVPGEKPTEAPEPHKLEESKAARRLPSVSAHEKEREERAEAKTYAAKPGPLREEDEETGRIGISSRRDLALKAPAAGLRMKRPTVLLSIDGPEGRPLPGLASAIPEALRQRFDFVNEAIEKPRVEKRKDTASSEKMAERDLRKLPDQTIRITVKVTRTEHGLTVTAKLFEKGSVDETKSITDVDIPIEKLPEDVGRIVGDLLAGR